MSEELKPCPFCGSRAEYLKYAGEENRKDIHKVACMADNSDHHGEEGVSEDWCPMEAQTDWQHTKANAAEIWNTRAETQTQTKLDAANEVTGTAMSVLYTLVNRLKTDGHEDQVELIKGLEEMKAQLIEDGLITEIE